MNIKTVNNTTGITNANVNLAQNSGSADRTQITVPSGLSPIEAGKALLEEHKAEWQEQLGKEGIQTGAVYFTNTNSLNLKDFNKNQTKEQKSGSKAASVQLYRAAKAFIAFVRQTGDTERKSI